MPKMRPKIISFALARRVGRFSERNVVVTSDLRLTDRRVPADGSITDARIVAGGLIPSNIIGIAITQTTGDARYLLAANYRVG